MSDERRKPDEWTIGYLDALDEVFDFLAENNYPLEVAVRLANRLGLSNDLMIKYALGGFINPVAPETDATITEEIEEKGATT